MKNKNETLWHWMPDCPKYPGGNKIEETLKIPPDNLLCPVCRQMDITEKNETRTREILDDDNFY